MCGLAKALLGVLFQIDSDLLESCAGVLGYLDVIAQHLPSHRVVELLLANPVEVIPGPLRAVIGSSLAKEEVL